MYSRCEDFFLVFIVIQGHKDTSLLFLISKYLGTFSSVDTVLGVGDTDE